jgi:sterol desaturase/sphingolipid hydroxylase (fatty acid hydroxylase superfamily)
MYTLLKSVAGPHPEPSFPAGVDMSAEARRSRGRLYPVTAIYTACFLTLVWFALRAGMGFRLLVFSAVAVLLWTFVEYTSHRYLMHRPFPRGDRIGSRILHYLFDALHADHHARPWDGYFINGHLDTLFVSAVLVPLSLLAPPYTASVVVVVLFACYVTEEWVHHGLHFWNLDLGYFQYLRRRHLYHHSRHGVGRAYGITSGIWDTVFATRIPATDRQRLAAGGGAATAGIL